MLGYPPTSLKWQEMQNVWKVVLQDQEETVIGAIGLYLDDILITGQGN